MNIFQKTSKKIMETLNNIIGDIIAEYIYKHHQGSILTKQQIWELFKIKIFKDTQQRHILYKDELIAIIDYKVDLKTQKIGWVTRKI